MQLCGLILLGKTASQASHNLINLVLFGLIDSQYGVIYTEYETVYYFKTEDSQPPVSLSITLCAALAAALL